MDLKKGNYEKIKPSPIKDPLEEEDTRDCGCAIYANYFFVYGRGNGKAVWCFDLELQKWKIFKLEDKINLNFKTCDAHSMVFHCGKVYFIGGLSLENDYTDNCYVVHTNICSIWKKEDHLNFPLPFRQLVLFLMCSQKFFKLVFPFPKPIFYIIFQYLSLALSKK